MSFQDFDQSLKCFLFLQSFFPAMTKIIGTLGSESRSVDIITRCLHAGMSGIIPLKPFTVCDLYSEVNK